MTCVYMYVMLHCDYRAVHAPMKVGTISEAYPHLIIDNLTSTLGKRTANILKHLFPVPKVSSI